MPERFVDLSEQIQEFRNSVNERVKNNNDFHEALNALGHIKYTGIKYSGPGEEPNKYSMEPHEALLWSDPIGYYDELDRWESEQNAVRHQKAFACLDKFDQRPAFSELATAIRKKRIAPFLGAGISVPMGYPAWGKSVETLIEKLSVGASRVGKIRCGEARAAYARRDYFQAVSLLYQYDRVQVNEFISRTFAVRPDIRIDDMRGPLLLLPDFAEGCIITTNFDRLIEKVYEKKDKAIESALYGLQPHNHFASALIKGERALLKLHGDAQNHETYIFSKAQYDRAYGDPINFTKPLSKILRQIYISHSLLFIGCSLGQDQTMRVFSQVAATKDFDIPQHFAFLSDPARSMERRQTENKLIPLKIKPIWYETYDNGKDHMELDFLLQLAVDASQEKVRI